MNAGLHEILEASMLNSPPLMYGVRSFDQCYFRQFAHWYEPKKADVALKLPGC